MRFCTRLTALRVIAPFNLRLFFLVESMRLAQVDRQEALGQLDTIVLLVLFYAFGGRKGNSRMELCAQGLNNLFPISMSGQTSSRGAADAMLAIELHIERVEGMSTGTDGDPD